MKYKKILIIIVAFVSFIVLFRISGVLRTYNIPSSSSEPNLQVGSYIVGSSLKKPKRLDFAYFKFSDSLDGWTIVKRLIAIPGDTLECRNGNYIVNGKNIDEGINLRFAYKMLPNVFDTYLKGNIGSQDFYKYYYSDSIIAFLDDSFVSELPIKLDRKFDYDYSRLSKEIFSQNLNWTVSNFGPVIVPKEKYFFSGDNRDNTIDSRYRGFVEKDNILGTVLINFY